MCDKAAILGGEEANKADLTVVTIPRRVLWGGQMAAARRTDPHCDGGRLAGRAGGAALELKIEDEPGERLVPSDTAC